MSDYNTSAIIESSLENVNSLREHLEKISSLRQDVKTTLEEVRQVPEHFDRLGIKLNQSTNQFISENYKLLKEQIIFFQEKIIDLNNRIVQIDEIDFRRRFENANEDFFIKLNSSVEEKINLFDETKFALDAIHKNLQEEVTKLQNVNLEEHFNKHDKRLSDIFGATNNINSSLLNIANQTLVFQEKLTSVEQKLSHLESKISDDNKVIMAVLKSIKEQNIVTTKKQNSSFTVLAILISIAIIASIVLHFI